MCNIKGEMQKWADFNRIILQNATSRCMAMQCPLMQICSLRCWQSVSASVSSSIFFLYLSENGLWHLMKPDRFSLCVEWNCCSFSDFTRLWTNNIQHTEWIHLHALALLRWYGVLLYIFSDAKVNLPCVQLHMERTAHTCRLLVLYSMFYIMEITAIHASAKKNTILRNIKYRAWVEKIIPI